MRTRDGADVITCRDCGVSFIVSHAEHLIYATRGHAARQRFCRECRTHRREERASATVTRCAPADDKSC